MNNKGGFFGSIIEFILVVTFVIMLMLGVNSCSADTWNNGVCGKCETRYELRGVSKSLKYYVCPDCGQEVRRY